MDDDLLQCILECGNDGYWAWHVPSGKVEYGGRWAAMLGYELNEIEPTHDAWARLIHPDDGKRALHALQEHWDGRAPEFETQIRMRCKSGEWHWVLSRGKVNSWIAPGRPERMSGVHIDIHGRKQAEDLIARHECVSNSIVEMVSIVRPDFVYEAVNDAWCHAMKLNRRQAVGQTIADIWGTAVFEAQIKPRIAACFNGKTEIYECWLAPELHGKRHLHVAMFPHWGQPGKVTQAIIVTRDTTAEKAAEQELVHAWRAAEGANQAKGAFLANMSHEIRTPLNAIAGMSFLLKQSAMSDKQTDYVQKIDSAAANLLRIVNDILDFSKVDAGIIQLENVEFNLDDVLSNLLQLTSLNAKQKSLGLRLEVMPDTPRRLIGDPLRLTQVLHNLTDNAIKFTSSGEVVVGISSIAGENSGVRLRFEVRDTGIGITAEQVQRIFEPFSQVDASAARRYGGTGLGLAISKRFVELMGGTIEVDSTPGRSTVFSFTAKFRCPQQIARETGKYPVLKSGRRALLIDSDESSRAAMAAMLREFAFDVCSAESGERGVAEMRRAREVGSGFALVLLDSSLPDIGWMEAAKRLSKEQSSATVTALVLVVSNGTIFQHINIDESGLDAILAKPVSRPALHEVVMNAISRATENSNAPVDRTPEPDAALKGARILLVEDNEVNQQIAAEILTLAGCEVTLAADGLEAVDRVFSTGPQDAFDAVLMDLHMPGMDGFGATRRIRADGRFSHLPIIAMTADAVTGVRERCLDAGMNDYLTKPFRPNELYATLAAWIGSRQKSAPQPVTAAAPRVAAGLELGLDCDSGIARVGGNRALYARLAGQFFEKYARAGEDVEQALKRGDREQALRTLHTIKGVTANLGFNALSQSAKNWEYALKSEATTATLQTARSNFQECYRSTAANLNRVLPIFASDSDVSEIENPPIAQAAHRDNPLKSPVLSLDPQLDHLARMLTNQDMGAPHLAQSIGVQLRGSEFEEEFIKLNTRVQQLNYSDAIHSLSLLRSRLQQK